MDGNSTSTTNVHAGLHVQYNSKQFSVVTFYILTFLLSWIAWLPGLLLTYDYLQPSEVITKVNSILTIIGGVAPSLVAFLLTYLEKGTSGVKSLWMRAFRLRLGSLFFPLFLIIPICVVLAHVVHSFFGYAFPVAPIWQEPWMIVPLFVLFTILVSAEEFGWRGFAMDRLPNQWGILTSGFVLGCTWALWHVPMFLSNGFPHHDVPLPFVPFSFTLILVSILISWFVRKSKSLAPAFILHAAINVSGELFPLVDKASGNYTSWILANGLLLVVVFVVVRYDPRKVGE